MVESNNLSTFYKSNSTAVKVAGVTLALAAACYTYYKMSSGEEEKTSDTTP